MRVKRLLVGMIVGAMSLQAVAYASIPDGSGSSAKGGTAAVTNFETTVKNFEYDKNKGKFTGKVTSGLEIDPRNEVVNECVEDRDVKMYRKYTVVKKKKNGKKVTKTVEEKVGGTSTDSSGAFSFKKDKKSGKYSVVVSETEFAFWDYYGATGILELQIRCLGVTQKL